MKLRHCTGCNRDLAHNEFYTTQHCCKECSYVRIQAWRKRNPEKVRALERRFREKNRPAILTKLKAYYSKNRATAQAKANARAKTLRSEAIAAYGGQCRCCGEKTRAFLSLDHVKNDGYEHRKLVPPRRLTYWLKINGYPSVIQLLCHNCNWGKRMNGGFCPHNPRVNLREPQAVSFAFHALNKDLRITEL